MSDVLLVLLEIDLSSHRSIGLFILTIDSQYNVLSEIIATRHLRYARHDICTIEISANCIVWSCLIFLDSPKPNAHALRLAAVSKGDKCSWNKCFIIYQKNAANVAACHNTSQVIKPKLRLLQYLSILQSWRNVTSDATLKLCRATKFADLPGVSTCRATSFECLRHIHLSLRQGTTDPSITSKSWSVSYFEDSSN